MINSKHLMTAVMLLCAAAMAAGCGSSTTSPEDVTEAPLLPPTNVIAKRVAGSNIKIMWDMSTQAQLQGYNVYRAAHVSDTFTKLNPTVISTNHFIDTTSQLGAAYLYLVRAVSRAGTESGYSVVSVYDEESIAKRPPTTE